VLSKLAPRRRWIGQSQEAGQAGAGGLGPQRPANGAAPLRWPELSGLVVLFLLFTRLSDVYAPTDWLLSPNQVAVGLTLLAMLLHRLLLRREGLAWDRVLGWMLVYATAIALSTIAAHSRIATLAALVAYLRETIIVFLLVNLITSWAGLRRATWTLVGSGVLLVVAAILHAVTGHGLGGLSTVSEIALSSGSGLRFDGPVNADSNYFAQVLTTVVPLALYQAWSERRLLPLVVGLGAVSVLSVGIVWTHSRGGFLALLVMLSVAVAMRRLKPARLLVLGLALAPVALTTPHIYWDRIGGTAAEMGRAGSQLVPSMAEWKPGAEPATPAETPGQVLVSADPALSGAGPSAPIGLSASSPSPTEAAPSTAVVETPLSGDRSLYNRSRVWRVGAQMFLEHPLTGVGKGNYYTMYPNYFWRVDPTLPSGPLAPHNTPAHIAAETGLFGLVAFGIVIAVSVFGLRDAKRRLSQLALQREAMALEAIEISLYGYLVASLFLHENIYQRYFWLIVALAAIGRQVALRSLASAEPATRSIGRPSLPK
jgi:putative inorganic carbon (HCO3(-)) transporter